MPMPLKQATAVGPMRAAYLCAVIVFHPSRFEALEREDEAARAGVTPGPAPSHAVSVQRAFWNSLVLVGAALTVGAAVGALARRFWGPAGPATIVSMQIVAAGILLWATLFLRGWDIQSIGGVTLTERVNQWWFRTAYWTGTAMLAASMMWPLDG